MNKIFLFLFLFFSQTQASNISIIALENCPYSCNDKAEEKGFVIDIISHIFKKNGFTVTYLSSTSKKEALNKFKKERFDVFLGFKEKDDPELIYYKVPLFNTYNVIATRQGSNFKYRAPSSFKNIKVAAIKELMYEKKLDLYLSKYKYNSLKVQMTSGHFARKHNLKKLRFEKVDAVIDDRISLRYFYFKKRKPFVFKIVHTFQAQGVNLALSVNSYKTQKYSKILYRGLNKLHNSKKLKEILDIYGLSEAYIRPLNPKH